MINKKLNQYLNIYTLMYALMISTAVSFITGIIKTESTIEKSSLLYDFAVVTKYHKATNNQIGTGMAVGMVLNDFVLGTAFGVAMSSSENYQIKLTGDNIDVIINNQEMFDKLDEGDLVSVTYQEGYRSEKLDWNSNGKQDFLDSFIKNLVKYDVVDVQPSE